ncbi:O-acetyl-ADP-ribose deacetylase [Terrisporobacter petrolearius]|uniref:Macro domain-containing protein n=1 Tax=Terrisporobacter hibernicus TaxID=2813371 RepID=A0AAX2ZHW4_9FIRM|nr:macro domain-containing protein [Terrisporobacter hibernicus]UEL48631.1 macro domain-containing protein [Terrisporobacter hibernicus]
MDSIDNRIKIVKDEVIDIKVDAVVNPTDECFSGSDGLDKLIQKTAGQKLRKKLSKSGTCQVGHSIITKGYDLNVKSIVHTCTPKWEGGDEDECHLLYSCYKQSIDMAVECDNKTIAIPSISSGNNKFPLDKSANIAYYAAWKMIKKYDSKDLETIYFSCTNKNTYEYYKKLSQDYKDIEFSLEMIEQYKKMDKYNQYNYTIDDFVRNLGVENSYNIFLLKEAFLAGNIELEFIEETVKVLKQVFLQMKNMSKNFAEKVYIEELELTKNILKEIFNTIDYDTIEHAKERTKEYFVHVNDYVFEKINNSYRY